MSPLSAEIALPAPVPLRNSCARIRRLPELPERRPRTCTETELLCRVRSAASGGSCQYWYWPSPLDRVMEPPPAGRVRVSDLVAPTAPSRRESCLLPLDGGAGFGTATSSVSLSLSGSLSNIGWVTVAVLDTVPIAPSATATLIVSTGRLLPAGISAAFSQVTSWPETWQLQPAPL